VGQSWVGAVAASVDLSPGESKTVRFFLAWHFPNREVTWSQPGLEDKEITGLKVGAGYSRKWPDMSSLLAGIEGTSAGLLAETAAFQAAMYANSTLPWYLIDSAAPRGSVLRSGTCFKAADGRLYGFEGSNATEGCCPLNCTHVWGYEQTLAKLFPDLERSMRYVDLQEQIAPNAIIPSRTIVPLEIRRIWSFWPKYTDIAPNSQSICTDGEMSTVLKTYREILVGSSSPLTKDPFFMASWPQC